MKGFKEALNAKNRKIKEKYYEKIEEIAKK
jgi:hypothetical protein